MCKNEREQSVQECKRFSVNVRCDRASCRDDAVSEVGRIFRTQHRASLFGATATCMPGFKRVELVSCSRKAGWTGNPRVVWMGNFVWTAIRHNAPRVLARAMGLLIRMSSSILGATACWTRRTTSASRWTRTSTRQTPDQNRWDDQELVQTRHECASVWPRSTLRFTRTRRFDLATHSPHAHELSRPRPKRRRNEFGLYALQSLNPWMVDRTTSSPGSCGNIGSLNHSPSFSNFQPLTSAMSKNCISLYAKCGLWWVKKTSTQGVATPDSATASDKHASHVSNSAGCA